MKMNLYFLSSMLATGRLLFIGYAKKASTRKQQILYLRLTSKFGAHTERPLNMLVSTTKYCLYLMASEQHHFAGM